MNLDELQSVQARERQSSDLQHLRSSFYREVGEYIQGLVERRAELVEGAEDPFSSPEVRQLSDDIETAEQTVEAIYERRVGKVVKKASITAAGMPVDADGLTAEEEALFEDLVARIERNREDVLSVLDGDAPPVSCSIEDRPDGERDDDLRSSSDGGGPADEHGSANEQTGEGEESTTTDPDGVSAADLMGEGPDEDPDAKETNSSGEGPTTDDDEASAPGGASTDVGSGHTEVPPDSASSEAVPPDARSATPESSDQGSPDGTGGSETSASSPDDADVAGIPRTTVRITADVGEVVGADDRDYDLGPEDVVTLPEPNADVLVEKDAAERLE